MLSARQTTRGSAGAEERGQPEVADACREFAAALGHGGSDLIHREVIVIPCPSRMHDESDSWGSRPRRQRWHYVEVESDRHRPDSNEVFGERTKRAMGFEPTT